ncbi:hypothetical protein ROZALSC1DRAFT_26801, partial [Rozella allomycis CSF55]
SYHLCMRIGETMDATLQEDSMELSNFLDEMDEIINRSKSVNLESTDEKSKEDTLWDRIEESFREHQQDSCPICLEQLWKMNNPFRKTYILSCSHAYHGTCIKNFEKFSSSLKCPVCRTEYTRKEIRQEIKDH